MGPLLALLAITAAAPPDHGLVHRGVAYGPGMLLTCRWFSNFENSRFEQCRTANGVEAVPEDGASLACLDHLCAELETRARRVAHWAHVEPVWGVFTVRLYGRVSVEPHEKRYLGDGTRTVLVEKLIEVRKR